MKYSTRNGSPRHHAYWVACRDSCSSSRAVGAVWGRNRTTLPTVKAPPSGNAHR
ncbi:hypothetical protein ACFFX0_06855 [Citricoccus parietis]|uniref:Uncharacterized protein n=1 Tax=Citricoccus parietis TaxID=592307 RepID=A0ABV5FW64_9MICC